ncbi:MAG: type V CRISPR-associated protein Cas12a/Cpf1 [Candidatus Moranbacteria bacterium]|nr:type V CRISPR-associated protein Cas12a/Cpf1 [Candidatus Moranbacteria bacterium]
MKKLKTKGKYFSDFTNLYELSKTLCFELKPVKSTQAMLEENKVFEKDKTRKEKYEKVKPYFDRLHREFVKESLQDAHLENLHAYFDIYKKWQKDKKDTKLTKELDNSEKNLREQIMIFFNEKAKEYANKHSYLKKRDIGLFFEEEVFQLLKERYGDEPEANITDEATGEKVSIFDEWKNFTGYFLKFHETRKNFYKTDGTSTAIATRAIDQNLKRFCDNWLIFEKIKNKIDTSEVEKNFNVYLENDLSPKSYSNYLLQNGIDKYNEILGGKTEKDGNKLRGVNELINEYRQNNKGEKLPYLKPLDKQILGEKEALISENEIDENNILDKLKDFKNNAEKRISALNKSISDFVENENYELDKIYISKEAFNTIAHKWTNETQKLEEFLYGAMKTDKPAGLKHDTKENTYKFPDFIALQYIKSALENIMDEEKLKFWKERYYENKDEASGNGFLTDEENIWDQFVQILKFEFSSILKRTVTKNFSDKDEYEKFKKYAQNFEEIDFENKEKMQIKYYSGFVVYRKKLDQFIKDFELDQNGKIIIKNFADATLRAYQMGKYFALEKKREWVGDNFNPGDFYTNPSFGYKEFFYDNAYDEIVKTYNELRNFLTKKPWEDVQKWKLNFESPSLCAGWDKDLESQRRAIIFKESDQYYLGIFEKKHNHLFEDYEKIKPSGDEKIIQKMYFKQQTNVFRQLPRFGFPYKLKTSKDKGLIIDGFKNFDDKKFQERKQKYGLTEELLLIKDEFDLFQNSKSKGDLFDSQKLNKLIQYYKRIIEVDYKDIFQVEHILKKEYFELNKLYQDFEKSAYELDFKSVSKKYIYDLVEQKKLYLFEIYNKDFSSFSSGNKNLHTLYFQSLFSSSNTTEDKYFQLGADAEIFFRPKAIEAKKVKRNFKREIIEKKRYSADKIFFHCPIKLNAGADSVGKGYSYKFNNKINQFLANNPDINIIGVDRGEKHLAYYSVINQKQEILDSGSLNFVGKGTDGKPVDYYEKLEQKAKSREEERKTWSTVESIKDLKKGYISQVVRKLADLAIRHNAIIVFEDLNMRFKQIRGGIEKSIYQQLEKALIEKLNFLVNKGEKNPKEAGHLLKAYQLAAPFTTFKEMGKQTGIIFYTQASYTSRIDPVTGWRPNLYLKYKNAKQAQEDILKFDKIEFNQAKNRFEFSYDLSKFAKDKKKVKLPKKTKWTVCSNVDRFYWNRNLVNNKGDYEFFPKEGEDSLTQRLKKLFDNFEVNYQEGQNIADEIEKIDADKKNNAKFFKDLFFYFRLICQIRNTQKEKEGDENDFIFSPVEPFFDSRKSEKFGDNLPKNGDDNGAYNIARKGIILLNKKIGQWYKNNNFLRRQGKKEEPYPNLFIWAEEWDNFSQSKFDKN